MVQAVMCCSVKNVLETDFHVSMHKVFAFGSDGASAMVGRNNSVTSRLKQVNQYLVNCHCVGHRCALSISQAADVVPQIRTYRDSLCAVYSFYASSSIRKKKLLDFQEIFEGSKAPVTLKQLHKVRWLSMSECVSAMHRAWDGVCLSLEEEASGRSGHPSAVAKGLCKQVATAKYLLITAMLCDILNVVSQFSKTFQAKDVDLSVVEPAVTLAISKLDLMKSEPSENYAFVLDALSDGKQQYRNVGITDNTEQTKRDVANMAHKFIDAICSKLRDRFPQDETSTLVALDKVLNPKRLPVKACDLRAHGEKYLTVLIKHYSSPDLDCHTPFIEANNLLTEWRNCSMMMHAERTLSLSDLCKLLLSTPQYVLQYPNLVKLATVVLIIPVTSVECERGFSCQNRIKTKFRARLQNPTLNNLMQITYFSEEHFCAEQLQDYLLALGKWKAMRERCLLTQY